MITAIVSPLKSLFSLPRDADHTRKALAQPMVHTLAETLCEKMPCRSSVGPKTRSIELDLLSWREDPMLRRSQRAATGLFLRPRFPLHDVRRKTWRIYMTALTVLTVGMTLSIAAKRAWERRGVFLTFAHSPGEAVPLLRHGDFDLCLLGNSVSNESRAKLAGIIREMLHSSVPVISIRDDVRVVDRNLTISSRTGHKLAQLEELMREAQTSDMGASYLGR